MSNADIQSEPTVIQLPDPFVAGRECNRFEHRMEEPASQGVRRIIVDLTGVTYLDSSGVGVLVSSLGVVKQAGGHVRFAGAAGRVMRILQLTEVHQVLPLDPSVEAARAAMGVA